MTAVTTEAAAAPRPYTLVAELTYRCPLRCAYCSNPVAHDGPDRELETAAWQSLFVEAEALGVLQLHLTGGEPLLRRDLEALVSSAHAVGLYKSLITSAVTLTRTRLEALAQAGLDHVQISVQGLDDSAAVRIAGRSRLSHKLLAAGWVRELGLPLTLNVVLHRENIEQVPQLIALGRELGAQRIELANTQYLGWALLNREALLPSAAQLERARMQAQEAREALRGELEVLFVLPDYHAGLPRPCMQGWAQRYMVVSPQGLILPCHQAHSLPGLRWERAGERPLREIWTHSEALNAYRGEAWMEEPCRSCERRHTDFGGCRCQAFHLTGEATATDPACRLSPEHARIQAARESAERAIDFIPLRLRRQPRSRPSL
jgi:PqqA peptide cyclase